MTGTEIENRTEKLLEPILKQLSFELVDVEYVKEGSDWYLRAYVDKEGGITVDDCETVSRALEKQLDVEDIIKDAYILEVSSPGLTRPLKKERDYERNKGKLIEVRLYKAVDGNKVFIGTLKDWDETSVTLDEDGKEITFERNGISLIRQTFEW